MTPISNYKKFLTELVRRHMIVLGPNIARDVALQIPGLIIDASGEITDLKGDPALITADLVNGYSALSAPITQLILQEQLSSAPDIKAEYTQPLPKLRLDCALMQKKN